MVAASVSGCWCRACWFIVTLSCMTETREKREPLIVLSIQALKLSLSFFFSLEELHEFTGHGMLYK